MLFISSNKNEHIKRLNGIQQKARIRKKEQQFSIEGLKEIKHAVNAGYTIESLYIKEGTSDSMEDLIDLKIPTYEIASSLFEQLCIRKTSRFIGVAHVKSHKLEELNLPKSNPFLLIVEAPEKPGNIGAILRTADAMGVDALLIVSPKTDLYNPNVIRSSVGCLFHVPVGMGTIQDIMAFLNKHSINLYSAALTDQAQPYTSQEYSGAIAIAFGTEDLGLSADWLQQSPKQIYIPMRGENDSLNVSVAVGIILGEASRQRN